jgi:hypothetical protein
MLLLVGILVLVSSRNYCGRLAAADDIPSAIAHATNGTTALLVRVDSSKIDLPPQLQELASANDALGPAVGVLSSKMQTLKQGLEGNITYLAVDLPYSMRIHARMLAPVQVTGDRLKQLAAEMWPAEIGQPQRVDDRLLLPLGSDVASAATAANPASFSPSQAAAWQAAVEANAHYPVQFIVMTPEYIRQTFRELQPELPPMLGGGGSEVLLSGAHWLSLGFDPGKLSARMVLQGESAGAAEALKQHLPKLYKGLLHQAKLDATASTMIMALLGLLQPAVAGDQLILAVENPEQTAAIVELVKAAIIPLSTAQSTAQTANNLKRLGLAIHNHESAYKEFPTYVELRKKQKPSGLSWRVHILPFIKEIKLYEQFKLDEPWDSPHNIQLLDKMPKVFSPVFPLGENAAVPVGHTTYLAPVGKQTVFGREKPIRFGDVADGTSNTIWVVEVKPEHAIPWTSPEEYPYDPQHPAAKLRVVDGKVTAGLLDGAIIRLPIDSPWQALFTINGGEVIQR